MKALDGKKRSFHSWTMEASLAAPSKCNGHPTGINEFQASVSILFNTVPSGLASCRVSDGFHAKRSGKGLLRKATSTFETYLGQRPGRRP